MQACKLSPVSGVAINMKRLLLTALLLLASPAWAATIEDATAAYARSDYAAVLKITRPLAAKGDPTKWSPVYPGSIDEIVLTIACGKK